LPNQYRISTQYQEINESLQDILVLIVYCSVEHEEKSDGQSGPNGNLPEVTLKDQSADFFSKISKESELLQLDVERCSINRAV
jgi:hypothetical protein